MSADRDALRAAAASAADRLMLGPRPGKKSIAGIKENGARTIWCLLSPREQLDTLEGLVRKSGLDWRSTPIEGGRMEVLEALDLAPIREALLAVADSEGGIYLHCSAGLHRTGFIAGLILAIAGFQGEALNTRLRALRAITADEVGEDRLALAIKRAHEYL